MSIPIKKNVSQSRNFHHYFLEYFRKTLTKPQKYSKMEDVKEWIFCVCIRKGVGKALKRLVAVFLALVMLFMQNVFGVSR